MSHSVYQSALCVIACKFHPNMWGTVVVVTGSQPSPQPPPNPPHQQYPYRGNYYSYMCCPQYYDQYYYYQQPYYYDYSYSYPSYFYYDYGYDYYGGDYYGGYYDYRMSLHTQTQIRYCQVLSYGQQPLPCRRYTRACYSDTSHSHSAWGT